MFVYLIFTAVIPLTRTGQWRGPTDVIAVLAYLSGVVPWLGMALLDLRIIGRGLGDEARLKLHATLVAVFLVVAHIAMIFGMLDPTLMQSGVPASPDGHSMH